MTIIVTGGAGFIGSNFIFHMLEKYPDDRTVIITTGSQGEDIISSS